MTTRILLFSFVALLTLSAACAQPAAPATVPTTPATLSALAGTYADAASYAYGPNVYGKRTFTFNHGTWTLHFILALDPELKNVVFEYRTLGTYSVQGRSATVPNAYEALFLSDKKYVKLRSRDAGLVQGFGLAACSLPVDEWKDVSEVGCGGWRPVAVCREDHDLLALDAKGGLYFGQRPRDNDMCTAAKRPTALTPPVVQR